MSQIQLVDFKAGDNQHERDVIIIMNGGIWNNNISTDDKGG